MEYMTLKLLADTECHLTLFARYAKDEIPDEIDGDDNLDNEPAQIPNRKATDVVEASSLNYTVLRPGYLSEGDEDDAVLTVKGEGLYHVDSGAGEICGAADSG